MNGLIDRIRVHGAEISEAERRTWIGWYEPDRLILPGDAEPVRDVRLDVGARRVTGETLITAPGQTEPDRSIVTTEGGIVTLDLSATPMFIGD